MPVLIPVTIPVVAPTVAFEVLLLAHVPPVVPVLASVVVAPTQMDVVPEMGVGSALTVTTAVLPQPVDPAKLMVVVPAEMAVTRPDVVPMVATEGLLLVHPVPETPAVSTEVLPSQRLVVPVMLPPPPLFTVMGFVWKQPLTI